MIMIIQVTLLCQDGLIYGGRVHLIKSYNE
jgi:hypothetical protein